MIRRNINDDDENPDRWLVSYADFITLLFAFFVVMYSVSSVNEGKYKELSSAINTAFASKKTNPEKTGEEEESSQAITESASESSVEMATAPPLPSSAPTEAEQAEVDVMTTLGKQIADKIAPLIKTGIARVIQNNRGLRIDIKDSALFTAGAADLIVPAKATLGDISALLLNNSNPILVEGHTDDTPIYIQNAAFFSNWELSAVRASSIVDQLNETGIKNIRLSALGYGPSQPISSNTSEAGRMTNRHISIVVLYNSLNFDGDEGVEIKPIM
jgi:chemotaxis protein MotB